MNSTDTEVTLLSAVEALTRPDVLARYHGTSHEHSWMELVRPTTHDERAEAKQQGKKLPKTVKTGQWWCPFDDLVVDDRPEEEVSQRIDRHNDPALLDQLEARVRSSLSDGGAQGMAGASVLIDATAFDLTRRIETRLHDWLHTLGANPGRNLTLRQLLTSWHTLYIGGVHPVGEDNKRALTVAGWETEIRDVLDPPDRIPYMGQPCPLCGETRAIRELEGNVENTVALWAVLRPEYRSEGSYGLCKACDTIIARDADPLRLRARMNGAIATHLTQTVQTATETS